jgi:hypothetical protein
MLHYDPELRRQFAYEHAQELADEMRRARPLTPDQAGNRLRAKLAAKLVARGRSLLHGKSRHAPVYDA